MSTRKQIRSLNFPEVTKSRTVSARDRSLAKLYSGVTRVSSLPDFRKATFGKNPADDSQVKTRISRNRNSKNLGRNIPVGLVLIGDASQTKFTKQIARGGVKN
jgi:hypothetical protein